MPKTNTNIPMKSQAGYHTSATRKISTRMFLLVLTVVLTGLGLSACATNYRLLSSRQELEETAQMRQCYPGRGFLYVGTDEAYHYFEEDCWGRWDRAYRLPKEMYPIENPLPLGSDEKHWKRYNLDLGDHAQGFYGEERYPL